MSRSHQEGSGGLVQLGGMSTEWYADPSRPENLVNMTLDRDGAWRTSGGFAQVLASVFGSTGSVRSLAWFSQHQGGRQWIVFEQESGGGLALQYVDFSDPNVRTIEASSIRKPLVVGPHPGSTFLEHADWLYVLNGYTPPIRWNGARKVPVGFTQRPPAPRVGASGYDQADATYNISPTDSEFNKPFQRGIGAQEDTGGDADASRWLYGYAITWLNDLAQESERSPISWLQGRNADTSDDVRGVGSIGVELPAAPANVFGVRLWRTVNLYGTGTAEGATMYLVDEFVSGAALHYVDDTPDYELVLQLDESALGTFPARLHLAALHQGRMWGFDGSVLRYSAPGKIEQFPAQNFYPLTGGPGTGIASFRGALVAFKAREVWLVRSADATPIQLSSSVGCASPRAIVEVPGAGLLFLAEDGPYLLTGALDGNDDTRIVPLGPQIGKLWNERVNRKALRGARGALNLADREVWLQVPENGDDRPRLGLVYHYAANAWSLREGYTFGALAEVRDHRGLLIGGSWDLTSSTTKGVHVYSRGYAAPSDSTVTSPWLRPGSRSVPVRVELRTLNVGRALTFQHHVDREVEAWSTASGRSLRQTDTERNRSTWGAPSAWGTAAWAPRVPVTLNLSVGSNNGDEFQWRVTGSKLAILAYEAVFVTPTNPLKRLHE